MSSGDNGEILNRRDFVRSLERGLAVIQAFSQSSPTLTLSEVARDTGLTRPTARRVLLTLQELGYVRSDGRRYALTPRVLAIGYAYLSSIGLPEIAQPHLQELAEQTHESCGVAALDGTEIVYVARVPTRRIFSVALSVGSRLPAYATSTGRVLLAHLPPPELDGYFRRAELRPLTAKTVTSEQELRAILATVRADGWALLDQELEEGVRSIAAPLRDAGGNVVAAITVSSHAGRVSLDAVRCDLLPLLLRAAEGISQDLRHRPFLPLDANSHGVRSHA